MHLISHELWWVNYVAEPIKNRNRPREYCIGPGGPGHTLIFVYGPNHRLAQLSKLFGPTTLNFIHGYPLKAHKLPAAKTNLIFSQFIYLKTGNRKKMF